MYIPIINNGADLLMDSKICVLDLFTGKYRNINFRNYNDDRQVGVLYFDRAVLDELRISAQFVDMFSLKKTVFPIQ